MPKTQRNDIVRLPLLQDNVVWCSRFLRGPSGFRHKLLARCRICIRESRREFGFGKGDTTIDHVVWSGMGTEASHEPAKHIVRHFSVRHFIALPISDVAIDYRDALTFLRACNRAMRYVQRFGHQMIIAQSSSDYRDWFGDINDERKATDTSREHNAMAPTMGETRKPEANQAIAKRGWHS